MFEGYEEHLENKLRDTRAIMLDLGVEQVLIASGEQVCLFRDDLHYPFKPNPYFMEWLPLPRPECYLLISLQEARPRLFVAAREGDFWHSPLPQVPQALSQYLDVELVSSGDLRPGTGVLKPGTVIIDSSCSPQWPGTVQVNPAQFLDRIDFCRAIKSDWQVECVRHASRLAVRGHQCAERLFRQGASEFDIHMGYLQAIDCQEPELPYDSIVCLNEHCSILHHWRLDKQPPPRNCSLLIDAGAAFQGHAADITRTYHDGEQEFASLVESMDRLQQDIVAMLEAGRPYTDFHASACDRVASLLSDSGIVRLAPAEILDKGIVNTFFPHGLGHLLGVQVHDRGGLMASPRGKSCLPPDRFRNLRLTRRLEKNMLVTIEPGIYFIDGLLQPWRHGTSRHLFDWSLIGRLQTRGGIRVEDNVVLGDDGVENITRDAFSCATPHPSPAPAPHHP